MNGNYINDARSHERKKNANDSFLCPKVMEQAIESLLLSV
jgi:hypothetical protein